MKEANSSKWMYMRSTADITPNQNYMRSIADIPKLAEIPMYDKKED